MSLYENILNISNKNIEEEIKSSIIDTRRQLCNLNEDRMCLIYSSYIYQNLKKFYYLYIKTASVSFSFLCSSPLTPVKYSINIVLFSNMNFIKSISCIMSQ